MKLQRHIPSILPAYGKRLYTYYRGQPILCNNCFTPGHVKRSCPNPKTNWSDHVRSVFDSRIYPSALFGTWQRILALNHGN